MVREFPSWKSEIVKHDNLSFPTPRELGLSHAQHMPDFRDWQSEGCRAFGDFLRAFRPCPMEVLTPLLPPPDLAVSASQDPGSRVYGISSFKTLWPPPNAPYHSYNGVSPQLLCFA